MTYNITVDNHTIATIDLPPMSETGLREVRKGIGATYDRPWYYFELKPKGE